MWVTLLDIFHQNTISGRSVSNLLQNTVFSWLPHWHEPKSPTLLLVTVCLNEEMLCWVWLFDHCRQVTLKQLFSVRFALVLQCWWRFRVLWVFRILGCGCHQHLHDEAEVPWFYAALATTAFSLRSQLDFGSQRQLNSKRNLRPREGKAKVLRKHTNRNETQGTLKEREKV